MPSTFARFYNLRVEPVSAHVLHPSVQDRHLVWAYACKAPYCSIVFGAPATFQRLMDCILRSHSTYAAAYLNDIIIYSNDWQRHMQHLRAVLSSRRSAGLTANPKKCAVGRVEVRYLGFHLGH
ncbi:MAG: reverse transcriptase family protein, partial [Plesiomonas shigelloides]